MCVFVVVFFFKQKTADEMRISDWSSDVCSSDLKIVGPGNAYVAAAKRAVFGRVGIDSIAGPSEIVVISDGNSDPRWIAMDLFSQAEHGEDSESILLSPDADFLDRVAAAMAGRGTSLQIGRAHV